MYQIKISTAFTGVSEPLLSQAQAASISLGKNGWKKI